MEEPTNSQPISAFTLFTQSKKIVMENLNTFGIVLLLPFLSTLFSAIRTGAKSNAAVGAYGFSATTLGLGAVVGLVVLIAYVYSTLFLYILNNESAKGKKPTISELWPSVQKYGLRLVGLSIVTVLILIGGFLLLIVPFFIFLRRYYLAPYAMIDKDLSITDSLKESARITKPYSMSIWTLFGVSILIGLTGVVPFVGWLISFVLSALYQVAPALRYFELKKLVGKA